jgi:biotin synthase
MIGLPGQTAGDLAEDIRFYAAEDIDMIGMGPYLPEDSTPMGRGRAVRDAERDRLFHLSLRMIALTRIALRDVNIAATTALQTLHPEGRARALSGGANVVMPILTPPGVRARYALYEGKAGVDSVDTGEIAASGRPVGFDSFGDAPHARRRMESHV